MVAPRRGLFPPRPALDWPRRGAGESGATIDGVARARTFERGMNLRIRHETLYSYTRAVRFGPHRLVIRPREGHDLHVEWMALNITPLAEITWIRDVFGNSVAVLDFGEARAKELRIVSEVLVRRTVSYSHRKLDTAPTPWPPAYDPLEIGVVAAYQLLSYPADAAAIRTWLETNCPRRRHDVEHVVRQLNRCIHRQIRYVRREEKGVLTPAETIARGVGSCRDFATLLLDAARSLGIAARFASGYLECSAAEAGYASTHAWVEIYLPGHGWRGFDPTLGTETTKAHVATGLSNHPRGVMPVTGSFYGSAKSFREMKVAVQLTSEPASPPPAAVPALRVRRGGAARQSK
jgi:transglutaminase-like putative cysteine protease